MNTKAGAFVAALCTASLVNVGCQHSRRAGAKTARPVFREGDVVVVEFTDNLDPLYSFSCTQKIHSPGIIGLPRMKGKKLEPVPVVGRTQARVAWEILLAFARTGAFTNITVSVWRCDPTPTEDFALSLEVVPDEARSGESRDMLPPGHLCSSGERIRLSPSQLRRAQPAGEQSRTMD